VIHVAAIVIFLGTIALIIIRPPRFPEWLAASAGAVLMIVVGVETPRDAVLEIMAQWNVLMFFAGLIAVVAVAESAGFFAWIALAATRAARGSGRRLFFAVIVAGFAITVFLTNDATAVVMTPLVFVLVRRLRLPPAPFAYACTFIANGASLALPISNPVNFIIGDASGMRLGEYVAALWPPALAAAVATVGILWLIFRNDVSVTFDRALESRPGDDPRYRLEVAVLAGLTALSLILTSAAGGFVGAAAAIAGAVLIAHGLARRALRVRHLLGEMNPGIVVMVAALFVAVDGVRHAGLLNPAVSVVVAAARTHVALAGPISAIIMAGTSNLFNNLPSALIAASILHSDVLPVAVAHRFAAGAIVGCDLGPNLTTVGSLSTLMWLVLLRRRGLKISAAEYLRVGAVLAPAVLACAIAALWLANS